MIGLIFGFDEDTPHTFRETREGVIEIGLSGVACSILTPNPGTEPFERMTCRPPHNPGTDPATPPDVVVFTRLAKAIGADIYFRALWQGLSTRRVRPLWC